jgi:hypothetical protein
MIKQEKGLALIAAVMLIVFVSIAVLGLTVFIVQWFSQINSEQLSLKCLYLAQAGIHDAIYEVRSTYDPNDTNGYFTLGQVTVDPGETYRRGGTAADLLMVDTSDTSQGSKDLDGLKIQKATSSASPVVSIDRMIVSWTMSDGGGHGHHHDEPTLQSIRIAGSNRWTGNLDSPADADLPNNYTLTNTETIPVNRLRFSDDMDNLISMSVEFVMTDGSRKTVDVYPDSNNCVFTIKSTGKVSGSSIYRTIAADYNLRPDSYSTASRIDNIYEINTEITSP